MSGVNAVAFSVFVILFVLVTGIGFAAARWRRAEDMLHLNEWGLGGRGFGTIITWFLLGGDLYTAYTFIAVPEARRIAPAAFGPGACGVSEPPLRKRGVYRRAGVGHSAGAQVVGAGCGPWCGVTSILAGMSTAGNSQTAKSIQIVTG